VPFVAIGRHDNLGGTVELRYGKSIEASDTASALTNDALAIGGRWNGVTPAFNLTGQIGEVVIWNRALSAAECDQYADYAIGRFWLP
jgi:hypothetical protein